MAKGAKIKLGCLDKISSLPDSILCRILSSIPIKDAVRTSILSTRWRYLFASMTTLQLDDRCLNHGSVESFMNFGDRLLLFSSEPSLECFQLVVSWTNRYVFDSSRVYEWVRAALGHGVKELDLLIDIKEFMLPTILFTCKSLVTLKLQLGFRMYVPRGACFPNLKKLQLTYMKFSDNDSVQRRDYKRDAYKRAATDLLHLIRNVQSLQFKIDHPETFSNYVRVQILVMSGEAGLAFENLVELKLTEDVFGHHKHAEWRGTWVVEFLQCTPNLQTLVLSIEGGHAERGVWTPPKEVPSCLLSHLKKIVLNQSWRSLELNSYFLKNARVLEELSFGINHWYKKKNQ
ncbi:hypothetical protein COLO4_11297 [Corchorus olitorius]|uniref:F-box domain-containing protein n=1 Tax=Corchorus olitorius TaxID=93759 RepID=A0A1R3K531_9ROSI|nr:hypothetical protein COLO4_11297 [Corchorus olitorius]